MGRPRRGSAGSGLGWLAVLLLAGVGAPAGAFEWYDDRVELHGFYESQTRVIARNFDGNDDWDLTQWYHVLNLELELDIAPDGFAFFDLISAFVRVETRFDCVWDRACHLLPSVNSFGDRTRHLPKRLSDSRYTGWTESQFTGDVRKRHGIPVNRLGIVYGIPPQGPVFFDDRVPMGVWNISGIDTLFGVNGEDQLPETGDEPAPFILSDFLDFRFASRKVRGTEDRVDTQVLGPWLPKNFVDPIAALAHKPNPFNPNDVNPILSPPGVGSTAQPYRPAPRAPAGKAPLDQQFARGIYYPNSALAKMIRENRFDNPDQNFRQAELEWNRGASQQQTKELREAYIDIELFDSSLWLRLGKQSIVWGKTELFRTTDQFNPQDVALATLPDLEESRISLWAARAVWSLWTVGSLEDVRLEVAANIDRFQGTDFGQCGEPYTVNAACNIRAGLFAHGIGGFGLAGVSKPPDPWDDIQGLEIGFRAEWRWDRFSFALTEFWGYADFPYVDQIFRYERNVDPHSGRPRRNGSRGRCINDPGGDGTDDFAGRLRNGPPAGDAYGAPAPYTADPACLGPGDDALVNHHANQQLFSFVCSMSIGFTDLDSTVCAQSVFNSTNQVSGAFPVARVLSTVMTGDPIGVALGGQLVLTLTGVGVAPNDVPFVDLGLADFTAVGAPDLVDGDGDPINNERTNTAAPATFPHLDNHLTEAQRGLLGCGPYWGQVPPGSPNVRPCSRNGIDLLNAEASALTSAWLTQAGVGGASYLELLANGSPAPGTVPYYQQNGRFWCQRYVNDVGVMVLPGCKSPFVAGEGWDSTIDGDPSLIGVNEFGINALAGGGASGIFNCLNAASEAIGAGTTGLAGGWCANGNPFTGEPWGSVMDAFSWNFQLLLIFFTVIGATGADGIPGNADDLLDVETFDPTDALNPDKCSYNAPQYCSNVHSLLSVMGRRRNSVLAGGTQRFGRLDFNWHGGTSNRLKWAKRNVLGFSTDFAEDITKTNWSLETTWIHRVPVTNNDALDGITEVDEFNMTISVDRPTFINFLNQGRTFFINSQMFFKYTQGFEQSMPTNGPWNFLFTLTAFTGFHQDRLTPRITSVYDFKSESGAVLPSIDYRFNESFSVQFGMSFFYGKWQSTRMPLSPISLDDHVGSGSYRDFSERGLAIVRDRDEAYLIFRKTF